MTATTPIARPAQRRSERFAGREFEPAALALVALTIVTAVAMTRLFDNPSFLGPVLAAALATHGAAFAARQARLPAYLAVSTPLVAATFVAIWFVLPSTTAYGIPWLGTWHAAGDALRLARGQFAHAIAPVPPTTGFVLAAIIGVALVAVLADWAAFQVGSAFEAVVPAFALFLLVAVLGDPRLRWVTVAVQLAAGLAFLAFHGAATREVTTPWFASRAAAARGPLLQGAAALCAVAVLAAVLVGPRLPGAHAAGLFDWRNREGEGAGKRTTISPLVDIRGRLVERSTSQAFTVASTDRAYWRLTALDTFDGVIWSSNDNYRKASGTLPTVGPQVSAVEIDQRFVIMDLASIWLPAGFRPTHIDEAPGVSFNADSSSLISREATSDGLTYRVVSQRPALTAADLSKSPKLVGATLDRYLALPDIAPRVIALARRVAGGQPTPYAQARVLQDHLRDSYRYDLGVDQGHDERALERFLFTTRRGYCEQFAAAYAVMARIVGLPSRVAVGFTPGEQGPDGTFHVLGLHAHAWPEVYLEGYGWVAFEPTPGRGAPGAQDYTGVPESQASEPLAGTATTLVPSTSAVPDGGTTTTATTAAPGTVPSPPTPRRAISRWVWVGLLLVLLSVAWVVAVPALHRARRARRRAAARTAAERVLVAWTEANETLGLAGARRRPHETLQEHAQRVRRAVPEEARQLLFGLAGQATEASYAESIPPDRAASAIVAASTLESVVKASVSRARRLRKELNPR